MASVLAWASTTRTASSGQKDKQVTPAELRGLYAITDETLFPESVFVATVEQALRGGAAIVQYRDKSGNEAKRLEQASALRSLCGEYNACLIINDDIRLAKAAELEIPVCAIGGIDKSNVAQVIGSGADMAALISGLFSAADIAVTAKYISGLFD